MCGVRVPLLPPARLLMDLPDDAPQEDYDVAYPYLVVNEIPSGFRGVIMATILAALMSSLGTVQHLSRLPFAQGAGVCCFCRLGEMRTQTAYEPVLSTLR